MSKTNNPHTPTKTRLPILAGFLFWALGWCAIYFFDGYLDTPNLALILILTSALASVYLPLLFALVAISISALVFDWFYISPRGSFNIDFHQHFLLLAALLIVNLVVLLLMARLRAHLNRAERLANESALLNEWNNILFQSTSPYECLDYFREILEKMTERSVALMVLKSDLPATDDLSKVFMLGEANIEQTYALWYSLRNNQQLGRGTGRYEIFSDIYLPIRSNHGALGAVLIRHYTLHDISNRAHLQAFCDQLGAALERYQLHQKEISAHEAAKEQQVKQNLLAAISHDYRTPLATIMSAASSLIEQRNKMTEQQQDDFLTRIYSETDRLKNITHQVLHLARLENQQDIDCDWQSCDELLAGAIQTWRENNIINRLQINLETNLPLIWCDPILLDMLIQNLVDNAVKYSPENSPIQLIIETKVINETKLINETKKSDLIAKDSNFFLSVISQGDPIDAEWRDKIFNAFQRGVNHSSNDIKTDMKKGAGIGLALCRAIAKAHKGELTLNYPEAGGNCFQLTMPLKKLNFNLES